MEHETHVQFEHDVLTRPDINVQFEHDVLTGADQMDERTRTEVGH